MRLWKIAYTMMIGTTRMTLPAMMICQSKEPYTSRRASMPRVRGYTFWFEAMMKGQK